MIKEHSSPYGQSNLILTLSSIDRNLIEPHLKPVALDKGTVLEDANTPIKTVYFLTSGIGSTVASTKKGRSVEVGLFGYEGMSGTAIVTQGEYSSLSSFMQIGGKGLTIEADRLLELMQLSPTLQRHLLRYVQVLMTQTSQTALSNGQSGLEERLARWLLMCHDRISGNVIKLTHEFLAIMLGVRRAGVTVGTHVLEGQGLIRAERGKIVILDRDGLVRRAKETYGVPEAEYARLIGFDQPGP
ncbi:Crp/Fnr family transcriptional regulator [Puniceibacterium confluentis]|uniref:Crp/Fnr family transcriptional regulator n=1 Tax=Puniceibacterium confluentis TaxID=1958944 RepID=UPI001FEA6594|nr:Crp/Fnr family transcriptional regulator [Puniceibacterium confluentis]